jgi:hypothetical protein
LLSFDSRTYTVALDEGQRLSMTEEYMDVDVDVERPDEPKQPALSLFGTNVAGEGLVLFKCTPTRTDTQEHRVKPSTGSSTQYPCPKCTKLCNSAQSLRYHYTSKSVAKNEARWDNQGVKLCRDLDAMQIKQLAENQPPSPAEHAAAFIDFGVQGGI